MGGSDGHDGGAGTKKRLRPAERRAAIIASATAVFADNGYRSTTTAQLADAAGVTQPILYRHFSGKLELYLACLEHTWGELRHDFQAALDEQQDDASNWLPALTVSGLQSIGDPQRAALFMRSLVEAHEEPQIREQVEAFLRDIHSFLADTIATAREQGGVQEQTVPRAEAWLFLAMGLLFALNNQLDDIVGDDFLDLLRVRHREVAPTDKQFWLFDDDA